MKLNLRPIETTDYSFERFMDHARHDKLQKALFMAIFRNLIYHGKTHDILIEVIEECQTVEEAIYFALNIDSHRESLTTVIVKDANLSSQVVRLGLTPPGEAIEDKEAFLREMETKYNQARKRYVPPQKRKE